MPDVVDHNGDVRYLSLFVFNHSPFIDAAHTVLDSLGKAGPVQKGGV